MYGQGLNQGGEFILSSGRGRQQDPRRIWVEAVAKADDLDLWSIRTAGALTSLVERVQRFNQTDLRRSEPDQTKPKRSRSGSAAARSSMRMVSRLRVSRNR